MQLRAKWRDTQMMHVRTTIPWLLLKTRWTLRHVVSNRRAIFWREYMLLSVRTLTRSYRARRAVPRTRGSPVVAGSHGSCTDRVGTEERITCARRGKIGSRCSLARIPPKHYALRSNKTIRGGVTTGKNDSCKKTSNTARSFNARGTPGNIAQGTISTRCKGTPAAVSSLHIDVLRRARFCSEKLVGGFLVDCSFMHERGHCPHNLNGVEQSSKYFIQHLEQESAQSKCIHNQSARSSKCQTATSVAHHERNSFVL